eukprot:Clim_evm61s243 gene=Clim_evmTU61s243
MGKRDRAKKAAVKKQKEEEIRQLKLEEEGDGTFQIRLGWQDPQLDLSLQKVSIAHGGNKLINDATVVFAWGKRYGIIGKNGSGKSSLVKAIAERQIPGIPRELDMQYVEQDVSEILGKDTLQAVIEADWEREGLLREEKRLTEKEEITEEDAERLQMVYERLEEIQADRTEARAAAILSGLQFTPEMQKRLVDTYSGGWRMRISLARALLREPQLLLLDEPTNHLDLHASIWLEDYLTRYPKTLVLISHNKEILNSVCNHILHIENQKLNDYPGNFNAFVKIREERRREQQKIYDKQQKQIKEFKETIERTRGNASTAGMASDRKKKLEKMEMVEALTEEKDVRFVFPDPGELQHPILRFHDAKFGYDKEHILYEDLSFGIDLKDRIALVGPNGCGKTTLLKLFSGELEAVEGDVERNKFLRTAVYSQHVIEELNLEVTAVQYMLDKFPDIEKDDKGRPRVERVRAHLGAFGLSGELAMRPTQTLSGGQKARLWFAYICWKAPHILLLDEPTNHLDMDSIDALIKALNEFKGGVVAVSHDSYFIDQVCEKIWICGQDKEVVEFEGDFNAYKNKLIKQINASNTLAFDFDKVRIH